MVISECKYCGRIHSKNVWCIVDEEGRFHSFDDQPSYSAAMPGNGYLLVWHQHGKTCRANGPAIVKFFENSTEESYYQDGLRLDIERIITSDFFLRGLNSGKVFSNDSFSHLCIKELYTQREKSRVFWILKNHQNKTLVRFVVE